MALGDAVTAFRLGREEMEIEHAFGKLDAEKWRILDMTRPKNDAERALDIRFIDSLYEPPTRLLDQRRRDVHAALTGVEGDHPIAYLFGNVSRPYAVFCMLRGFNPSSR